MTLLALLALGAPAARAVTFTVINTNDVGAGSLRQAILDANANGNAPTVDVIELAIPGAGVHTITLASGGPVILEPVTIDATTQPGTTTLPLVELVAGSAGLTAFAVSSVGVTIRGFAINGFGTGVYVSLGSGGHATVLGNFIGTDATGAQSPNAATQGTGVFVDRGSTAQIGGPGAGDGNVIASHGIGVHFPIGNGSMPGSTVAGNFIGTDRDQAIALGNGTGVRIAGLFWRVPVNGNVIAENTDDGVFVCCGNGSPILDNSFYGNGSLGIDLDGIGNQLQAAPVLTTAATDGLATRLTGTQTIPPSETIRVQLFTNPVAEQQGRTFVGEIPALAGGSFDVTFPVGSTLGHFASGTATRPATNDTSEFSNDVQIVAAPLLAKSFDPASIFVGAVSTLRFTLTNLAAPDLTGVSLSDSYPAGLLNASPASPATTCGGVASFGAAPGGGSFSAGGLTVPANGSCEVTVNVTGPVGSYPNTVAAGDVLSSNGPNLSPAGATLEVLGLLAAPTVTKSFTPPSIAPGGTSTLTITLTNPNGMPMTGVTFTDVYPAGLANTTTPGATTTCGGVVVAPPGPSGNGLALGGATIPANGSCTVSAAVTASASGTYTNDLPAGAVTSDNAEPNDGNGSSASLGVAGLLEVPAVGGWGLGMLAALLAGAGLLALRRR
jgi:uncharacterized repeat protein (TIGR01451 family)